MPEPALQPRLLSRTKARMHLQQQQISPFSLVEGLPLPLTLAFRTSPWMDINLLSSGSSARKAQTKTRFHNMHVLRLLPAALRSSENLFMSNVFLIPKSSPFDRFVRTQIVN